MGKDPEPDDEVSLQELVDKKCQILVEDRSGNKEGWQDITQVMPAKSKETA